MAEPPAPLTRAAAGGGRGAGVSPPCRESQPCGRQRHGLMDHLQACGTHFAVTCRQAKAAPARRRARLVVKKLFVQLAYGFKCTSTAKIGHMGCPKACNQDISDLRSGAVC
ncbi:hypothetical protein Q9233_001796 [Columba guinea]|nr:hypothetical protein Q9233_001796 [Columba guinea]